MTHSMLSSVQNHYKQHREQYNESFRLRIHRALSWLASGFCEPAQQVNHQALDTCFIHLWIAFNAAYASEIDGNTFSSDKNRFHQFLQTVCKLDKDKHIYHFVWRSFSGNIREFLKNRYIFQPFWDFHNGNITQSTWEEMFQAANRKVHLALSTQDTEQILFGLFNRLYTLRNQIIHGGSTFNSSANRHQLKEACLILSSLIPIIIQIMMNHHEHHWGNPFYPFIQET